MSRDNDRVANVIEKLLAYAEKLGAYPKYYQNSVKGGISGTFNEIELRLWVKPDMFTVSPENYSFSAKYEAVASATVEDPPRLNNRSYQKLLMFLKGSLRIDTLSW